MPSKATAKRKATRQRAKQRRGPTLPSTTANNSLLAAMIRVAPATEVKSYTTGSENNNLHHNASNGTTSFLYNAIVFPLEGMAQGTGDGARVGNSINVKSIKIRLWLSNKSDRSNVIYRIIAGVTPGPALPNAASFITGNGNCITRFNSTPENGLVVYDKVINRDIAANTIYPSANTLKERSYFHEFEIPWKIGVQYINASTTTAGYRLCVMPMCYDAFGSLATDNIASYAFSTLVEYTDQ